MVDKRPIFQPIIMWAAVILSAHLHASPEKTQQLLMCASVCRIFSLQLDQIGGVHCVVVSSVCGLWPSWLSKGHLLLFFFLAFRLTSSAHNMCLYPGWGPSSYATKHYNQQQAPPLVHSKISPSGVSGALPLSLLAHPLSVCLSGRFAMHASPLPVFRCYRWDLRLSASAGGAARRRRKQDGSGSTVISRRALSPTIPCRSLYSLQARPSLDICMCQQSHRV